MAIFDTFVAVKLVAILLMMSWGSPQYMFIKRSLLLENEQNLSPFP